MEKLLIVILVVAGVLLVGALIRYSIKQVELWKKALRAVAQRFGLEYVEGGFWKASYCSGLVDGFELKVDSYTVSTGKSSTTYTRIVLDTVGKIPRDLQMSGEGIASSIKKAFSGSDVQVGDLTFDERVFLKGDLLGTVSRMNGDTRKAALEAISNLRGNVKNGKISITRTGLVRDPQKLGVMVESVIQLAQGLTKGPKDIFERLADMACNDTQWGVRLKSFEVLLSQRRRSSVVESVIQKALSDPVSSIRLLAAKNCGAEGQEILEELAASKHSSEDVRAAALSELVSRVAEQARPLLEAALSSPDELVRETAIDGFAQVGGEQCYGLLAQHLDDPSAKIASAIAKALGAIKHPDGEQALLKLLEREDDSVQIAVAHSLGKLGTVKAVEPLLEYTKGLFTDGDLKDAARAAVESIQSRLGNADHGWLSMSEVNAEVGGLSVEKVAGALSETSRVTAEKGAQVEVEQGNKGVQPKLDGELSTEQLEEATVAAQASVSKK